MLKEVSYKDLKFNPFRLIGDEWMLVTAGNEKDGCNTMTASWGGIGCLWGHVKNYTLIFPILGKIRKDLCAYLVRNGENKQKLQLFIAYFPDIK
ncbi:MAG: hypothetical protein PUD64_04140 [Bacteroidales bacterium]|nr:hypothetical protein [Bacteroidales bacterium]